MKKTDLYSRSGFNSLLYKVSLQSLSVKIQGLTFFVISVIFAFAHHNVMAQENVESQITKNSLKQNLVDLKNFYQLSQGLFDAGYYKNAAPYAVQAYQQVNKHKGLSTNAVVVANNLAVIKSRLGEYKEARRLLQASIHKLTGQENRNSESSDRQLQTLYVNLFELNIETRQYELAEVNLNRIIKIDTKYYSAKDPVLMHDTFLKIRLEYEKGNNALSRRLLSRHLSHMPTGRLYNEARAEAGLLSAKLDVRALNYVSAIKMLKQALLWQGDSDTQLAADIYQQLAHLSVKSPALGGHKLAKIYQRKQLEVLKHLYGDNHPNIAQALVHFFDVNPDSLSNKQKKFVLEVYTQSFGAGNIRTLKILNRINNPTSVYNQAAL